MGGKYFSDLDRYQAIIDKDDIARDEDLNDVHVVHIDGLVVSVLLLLIFNGDFEDISCDQLHLSRTTLGRKRGRGWGREGWKMREEEGWRGREKEREREGEGRRMLKAQAAERLFKVQGN